MIEQRLIFTLLPSGLSPDGTKLTFSVLITPRLITDQTPPQLALFPDWTDWPATVRGMTFRLLPFGGTPVPATVVGAAPQSPVWKRLFAPASRVESYAWQSFSGRPLWSYPAKAARDFIRSTYATILQTYPTAPPANKALVGYLAPTQQTPVPSGILGPVAFGQRYPTPPPVIGRPPPPPAPDTEDQAVADIVAAMASPNFAVPPGYSFPVSAPGRYELLQAKLFHRPRTAIPAGQTYAGLTPPATPTLDFHQAVSLLGDHSPLQRVLGLVVDLEVPLGSLTPNGKFAADAVWTPALAGTVQFSPDTLTDSSFLAAPRTASSVVSAGLLQLQRSTFGTVEFDIDGATRKLLTTARVLWNRAQGYLTTPATPATSTVASLRTGGIGVAWAGLASALATASTGSFAYQDQLNSAVSGPPTPITLGAEDLTKGWRVDVYDTASARWYQLCARVAGASGGYLVGSPPGAPVPIPAGDEGHVQLAPTGDATGASSDLYLQEVIFRWNGWSLIAPRPGQQLATDPTAPAPVPDPANPAGPDFPVSITYAVPPGTLPRLRFGHTYRFRARAVDVAGTSLPFDSAGTAASLATASPPVTYRRLEPVASPQMLLRAAVTPGESVEVLVIRSNYDIPDPSVTPTERHLAPPPMAELLAEEHGLLDGPSGTPDPATYSLLSGRDGATFAGGTPDPVNRGVDYYSAADLAVPYLPDVLARGAAFAGLPGVPAGAVVKVPFKAAGGAAWPTARSFRLVVAAGGAAPTLPGSAGGAPLTVSVPKGTQATVALSSYLGAGDLAVMALWNWPPAAFRSAANRAIAAGGGMWMLTPAQTLLLVHAVRQPNTAPALQADFAATRTVAGDTTAQVTGDAGIDAPSTDRVDILATWAEPVDTGTNADPVSPQPFSADLGRVSVPDTGAAPGGSVSIGTATTPMVQHFGDTKRHDVAYQALATTRYAKYFTETAAVVLAAAPVALPNLLGHGVAPGTVTVSAQTGTPPPTYVEGTDYAVDYAAGTLSRLPAGAITSGQTVDVGYVPAPITRSSLENEPGGRPFTIPNSASPAKPVVQSVVPAWSFSASSSGGAGQSVRRGGTLRVYLQRPWWSSGPEELLGVILPQDTSDPTTAYGRDPLHPNGSLPEASPADYTLAVQVASDLRLPAGHGPVKVAGHAVSFDSARNLWFADVHVSPLATSYFPFVQLVLARYQPGSLSGFELSAPVAVDMLQAVPNRTLTATTSGINPAVASSVPVVLQGPRGDGPYGQPGVVHAVVQLQSGGSDDLDWADAGPSVALGLTSGGSPIGTWKGTVTRPAGTGPYRVLVTEEEQYFRGPSAPGSTTPGGGVGTRLVYADTLAL